MFRVLIAVALIQHNLGKPLEDGLVIPHDVEMIPVEEHGHHIITTASLERIYIEDIPLNEDYEGEIDDDDNIPRPDRAIDTAPCSAEEEEGKGGGCKDESSEADLKQETTKHVETAEQENVETNESVEATEDKETDDGVKTNEGKETNESVETNESLETNESVETNEVVLLNQTIRLNSSAIVDGKLTIVLHFEVQDDHTINVVSSEIIDPAHATKNYEETVDHNDDIIYFSGPVHAHGKVCVAAHYGCGDDHTVGADSSEIAHPGDVSKDSNETVYDEDHDDENDDEDGDNVHFCGPVHAQGNVCIGAHYGCGGPPISMSFSRPCAHGHHFFHPSSENDHDLQEDDDYFIHCQYRCPNIAYQFHPSLGSCGSCRIPENHFDHHHNHHSDNDRHINHHFDQNQDHHFDYSQNHLSDHHRDQDFDHDQDYHFDHHHDHFDRHHNHQFDQNEDHDFDHDHQENQYEDFEEYFNRILNNSDYDSGEEDDFPRWFPVSGYVPASGSVKIAAQY